MTSAARYAIGDLARLAGVSRRTVRYDVQENLIPAPLGVGRGDHYGPEHLERILRVKTMQEAGKTLDEIRQADVPRTESKRRAAANREPPATSSLAHQHYDEAVLPERSIWRRLTLAPGVELQIAGNVRLPWPGKLQELAEWCRLHLVSTTDSKDGGQRCLIQRRRKPPDCSRAGTQACRCRWQVSPSMRHPQLLRQGRSGTTLREPRVDADRGGLRLSAR